MSSAAGPDLADGLQFRRPASTIHYEMPKSPLIAIPHWRAPTWERTKYYYDSLVGANADYSIVEGNELPAGAKGLVLTGGIDVDPGLYGQERGPHTDKPSTERDQHELALLRQALDRDIPVLAVCRSHELLNVAFGGSLLQHIEGDGHRWHDDGASRWHEVTLNNGSSRLAGVYGAGATISVNSRHHQGVLDAGLATGLVATARAPDGFVEAVESSAHRWVVGVQWHPERPEMHPQSDTLWGAFALACAE